MHCRALEFDNEELRWRLEQREVQTPSRKTAQRWTPQQHAPEEEARTPGDPKRTPLAPLQAANTEGAASSEKKPLRTWSSTRKVRPSEQPPTTTLHPHPPGAPHPPAH